MKTNERDIELIERYIDDELQGEDLEAFEKRLKVEPELAKEYEARKKLVELWKETAEYETTRNEISAALYAGQSSFFRRNKAYLISIAASIAVLFGVYLMFFQQRNNNMNNGQQIVVSDSVLQFQMDEPKKLATMDSLNNSIILLFPVNNVIFTTKDPVVFKWRSFSDKTDTLYIFNMTENFLIKKQIRHHSTDTNIYKAEQLSPGRYYWHFADTTNKGTFSVINNK